MGTLNRLVKRTVPGVPILNLKCHELLLDCIGAHGMHWQVHAMGFLYISAKAIGFVK